MNDTNNCKKNRDNNGKKEQVKGDHTINGFVYVLCVALQIQFYFCICTERDNCCLTTFFGMDKT